VSANAIEQRARDAAVRTDGKRWCTGCGCYHQASAMKPFRGPNGGVIYRCQRWIEARERRRLELAACAH